MKNYFLTFYLLLCCLAFSSQANTQAVNPIDMEPNASTIDKTEQTLSKQRQLFKKIQQLSYYSAQPHIAQLIQQLLAQIENYPLYPYALFDFLRQQSDLTLEKIEQFQQQHQLTNLSTELKQVWFKQAQQKQLWSEILANASSLPADNASQCIYLQAQQQTNTISLDEWATQSEKLWLTGELLPIECNELMQNWESQFLSQNKLRQRAILALEKNNRTLLLQLKHKAEPALIPWLEAILQLQQQPTKLFANQSPFHPQHSHFEQVWAKPIFISQFPRAIKYIDESAVKNLQDPFQPYAEIARALLLNEQEITEWKKQLLTQLFDSENLALQQWRDNLLITLKQDNLTERRIRTALRKKQDYSFWLNLLSDSAKNKAEWQFWQAQILLQKNQKEQAQAILLPLSRQRGFYAMLASVALKKPYQPPIQHFSAQQIDLSPFAAELARLAEFRWHNDIANMNKQWKQLLQQADFQQKLALSSYAQQQDWFDLAVEATIQAKAWDFLALRLPNAYQDMFDLHLTDKKINRTFAMAIARQESAWKPYVSSTANAKGLMQLLPTTAQQTAQQQILPYNTEKQLFDPFDNIMLGTAHLQQLYDKYGNNRILIAAAYNAGASRVENWLAQSNGKLTMAEFVASIPFWETRGYVQNVLAYDAYYQLLQQQPQTLFYPQEDQRLY